MTPSGVEGLFICRTCFALRPDEEASEHPNGGMECLKCKKMRLRIENGIGFVEGAYLMQWREGSKEEP